MLKPEQEKVVVEFGAKLSRLDSAIADLENQRDQLLESFDEQYAGYRNHYSAYYDDEPLSIREYYEAANEFDELMERWNVLHRGLDHNDPDVDYSEIEEFDKKTAGRFAHLERVLGA
jgi:hypothetical protein